MEPINEMIFDAASKSLDSALSAIKPTLEARFKFEMAQYTLGDISYPSVYDIPRGKLYDFLRWQCNICREHNAYCHMKQYIAIYITPYTTSNSNYYPITIIGVNKLVRFDIYLGTSPEARARNLTERFVCKEIPRLPQFVLDTIDLFAMFDIGEYKASFKPILGDGFLVIPNIKRMFAVGPEYIDKFIAYYADNVHKFQAISAPILAKYANDQAELSARTAEFDARVQEFEARQDKFEEGVAEFESMREEVENLQCRIMQLCKDEAEIKQRKLKLSAALIRVKQQQDELDAKKKQWEEYMASVEDI